MNPEIADQRTVLFSIPHEGYLRNFIRLIAELIDEGYAVHVALDPNRRKDAPKGSYQRCLDLGVVFVDVGPTVPFRSRVGQWVNTLMGVEIHYAHSQPQDPAAIRAFRRAGLLGNRLSKMRAASRLRLPTALQWSRHDIRLIFQRHDYHALFISPAVEFGSDAWEWIDAAHRHCVPSMLLVASWDNLTNKSTLGRQPDWVLVWSHHQADEARIRHGVPPDRIRVIGSLVLSWHLAIETISPKSSGHVIYAGSSAFLSAEETSHFLMWCRAIREDPDLRDLPIVVRLHPNGKMTRRDIGPLVALDPFTQVFGPDVPDNAQSEIDYAEQLDSAIALVGINTSAFIDAAIRGVPVFALDSPEVREAQTQSEHFRTLQANRGVKLTPLEVHLGELTALRKHWPQRLVHTSDNLRRSFVFPAEPRTPEQVTSDLLDDVVFTKTKVNTDTRSSPIFSLLLFFVAAILWITDRLLIRTGGVATHAKKRSRRVRNRLSRRLQRAKAAAWRSQTRIRSVQASVARLTKHPWCIVKHGRQFLSWRVIANESEPSKPVAATRVTRGRNGSTPKVADHELAMLLGTSSGPGLLGPWTAEVGYEVLYWTAFLEYLVSEGKLEGAIPISRGGTKSWYPVPLQHGYEDVLDCISPTELKLLSSSRISSGSGQKSINDSAGDIELLNRLSRGRPVAISQSKFFEYLRPYLYGHRPIKQFLKRLTFTPLASNTVPVPPVIENQLPSRYIAASIYGRPTFSGSDLHERTWNLIRSWSGELPIVDINPRIDIDDHSGILDSNSGFAHPLVNCSPSSNLALQTEIIARSEGLIATHGGIAYLGLRCGKDVLALQRRGSWILPVHSLVAAHMSRECHGHLSTVLV